MKTFITVIQTSKNKFEVFDFIAESQQCLFPKTSKKGVLVSCWEKNDINKKYCIALAEEMNKH